MTKLYKFLGVSFDTPRSCPECGTPALKGKGEYGTDIESNKYGHRYGHFCSLRCGVNFANHMMNRQYRPNLKR